MTRMRASSPHLHSGTRTPDLMRQVLLATVPGALVLTGFFGTGVLINLLLATASALAVEALALRMRQRPILALRDGSALLTGVLLALALPPYCPWWLVVVGVFFAIGVAKHLYGGLGHNPFNPAMVGYAVLLVAFPAAMTQWPLPLGTGTALPLGTGTALPPSAGSALPGPVDALLAVFAGQPLDGLSGATPLEAVRHKSGATLAQVYASTPALSAGRWAGAGWEWANLAFLAGGVFLLYRRVIAWQAPVAFLATLGLLAFFFYDSGSSNSPGSPLLHWLSGGTLLAAFFIVTDPVTSATSPRGRLIFGAGTGLLVYVIRAWGGYPDAIAFAVLLMNFAAPFIDRCTPTRPFGRAS